MPEIIHVPDISACFIAVCSAGILICVACIVVCVSIVPRKNYAMILNPCLGEASDTLRGGGGADRVARSFSAETYCLARGADPGSGETVTDSFSGSGLGAEKGADADTGTDTAAVRVRSVETSATSLGTADMLGDGLGVPVLLLDTCFSSVWRMRLLSLSRSAIVFSIVEMKLRFLSRVIFACIRLRSRL